MFSIIKRKVNQLFRKAINQQNKLRLTNHHFSVISSNCNGAFMLHDLGERFNSPFVNLYLTPKDFIRYLKRIEYYQHQPIAFPKEMQRHYPVGLLDDITLYFMHYHSEQEAVKKWQERTARLNLDNLFIIMTDRDGCSYEDLVEFDQLLFKHKIVFTHKAYPELESTFYIQGFEHLQQVGDLFEFSGWNGKKYYDQFDYVGWFNQN